MLMQFFKKKISNKMAFSGNIYCLFSTARIKLIVYHARISTLNIFSFVFNSLSDASFLVNNYTTQWSDDKTCPVHVTENMDHYLMSQAVHIGLGDFNRKNLIAATFTKHNGTGKHPESDCLCLFVSLSVWLSVMASLSVFSVYHSIFLSVFLKRALSISLNFIRLLILRIKTAFPKK